jgi:C-terminal processing protease CtpA/Prc
MYKILEENYPFFEVKKRTDNIDWLAKKDEYRKRILNTKNDEEFKDTLIDILRQLNDSHTNLLSDSEYKEYLKIFSTSEGDLTPWISILENENVVRRYDNHSTNNKNNKGNNSLTSNKSFKSDIIKKNKIAYLKLYNLNPSMVDVDGSKIYEFFKQIQNYQCLIIDLRGNGGGANQYWENNIVSQLTNKELKAEYNVLSKNGEYAEPFFSAAGVNLYDTKDINKGILNETIEKFPKYYKYDIDIIPSKNTINFKGQIYLLVDQNTFSAADMFTNFSKSTNFAKVLGEKTKGGGTASGLDLPLMALPNSGYVIRFSIGMQLNPDGSIEEEEKVNPDILINANTGSSYANDEAIQKVMSIEENQTLSKDTNYY